MKAAYREIARIDAEIRDRLLKRARKHGIVTVNEIIELVEEWKVQRRGSTGTASMVNTRDTDLSTRIVRTG